MMKLVILAALATAVYSSPYQFAPEFEFGAASSSYQVEGGWNAEGKGESIWDRLTHQHPDWVKDGSNGDTACDSYNKVTEDVLMLKNLGVNFYRFSISWSRVMSNPIMKVINEDGIRYYNELIDALLTNGIQPYVNMYHWDLPQQLQDIGGWTNPQMTQFFEDFADVLFSRLGDRVKVWMTFNEPVEVCRTGYGEGFFAPAITLGGIGDYLCGKTLLLAHARAYRLYESVYKPVQNGVVGIAVSSDWYEPDSDSPEDIAAAERKMWMEQGWWVHPIYLGDYPRVMIERIAEVSAAENFTKSRLPPFTAEEVTLVVGTADFLGLNHYSTWMFGEADWDVSEPSSNFKDIGGYDYQNETWESSALPWLKVVPWGLRSMLVYVKNTYGNPPVYITENGFVDVGEVDDQGRVSYYLKYFNALLDAINVDGCNVKGYTAWSLMDNFEWREGYTAKFGLYQVDFNDPNRKRTAKASAEFYKNVIISRTVPDVPIR